MLGGSPEPQGPASSHIQRNLEKIKKPKKTKEKQKKSKENTEKKQKNKNHSLFNLCWEAPRSLRAQPQASKLWFFGFLEVSLNMA